MQDEKTLEEYLSKYYPEVEVKTKKEEFLNNVMKSIIEKLPEEKQKGLSSLIDSGASQEEMTNFLSNSGLDVNEIMKTELEKIAGGENE